MNKVISPNLLPDETIEELHYQTIEETIKKVVQVFAAIVLFFWILEGALLWKINQEKNNIEKDLEANIDSKKIQELNNINSQFKELRVLSTKVDKSLQEEYFFSKVLAELPKLTPQGTTLTSFETVADQPGWIKIKGTAQNRTDFTSFERNIEKSPFYEKVESPLSNYVSPENVGFELNVLLKDWKPTWANNIKKKTVANNNQNQDTGTKAGTGEE